MISHEKKLHLLGHKNYKHSCRYIAVKFSALEARVKQLHSKHSPHTFAELFQACLARSQPKKGSKFHALLSLDDHALDQLTIANEVLSTSISSDIIDSIIGSYLSNDETAFEDVDYNTKISDKEGTLKTCTERHTMYWAVCLNEVPEDMKKAIIYVFTHNLYARKNIYAWCKKHVLEEYEKKYPQKQHPYFSFGVGMPKQPLTEIKEIDYVKDLTVPFYRALADVLHSVSSPAVSKWDWFFLNADVKAWIKNMLIQLRNEFLYNLLEVDKDVNSYDLRVELVYACKRELHM